MLDVEIGYVEGVLVQLLILETRRHVLDLGDLCPLPIDSDGNVLSVTSADNISLNGKFCVFNQLRIEENIEKQTLDFDKC